MIQQDIPWGPRIYTQTVFWGNAPARPQSPIYVGGAPTPLKPLHLKSTSGLPINWLFNKILMEQFINREAGSTPQNIVCVYILGSHSRCRTALI